MQYMVFSMQLASILAWVTGVGMYTVAHSTNPAKQHPLIAVIN